MTDDQAKHLQFTRNGQLRHLLTLEGIDRPTLIEMLDDAERFLSAQGRANVRSDSLRGRTVANLFFEPSTRTRASFDLAGKRLGADVLNLDVNTSSRKKGESILDTIYTLEAMGTDVMVIRDASAGVPAFITRHVSEHVCILNAGEADVSHPTQGLLDMMTIRHHKSDFANLKVAIVFVHQALRFEAWLGGYNKQVQAKYWKLFKESGWDKYHLVPTTKGVDAILEYALVEEPDFDDLDALTEQIERKTLAFTRDIEAFLLEH